MERRLNVEFFNNAFKSIYFFLGQLIVDIFYNSFKDTESLLSVEFLNNIFRAPSKRWFLDPIFKALSVTKRGLLNHILSVLSVSNMDF